MSSTKWRKKFLGSSCDLNRCHVCGATNENTHLETASCAQLVMGAYTHCFMYVMLKKSHPKCPQCSSDVLVDFVAAPSSTPTPAAVATTTTTTISSCIKRQRVAQAWRLLNNACFAVRSLAADPCLGNTQQNLLQTENKALWSVLSSCSCRKNRL